MDGSRLTRLGTESSQTDVKCLEFRKALRVSSQNILLAKLGQVDLDMTVLEIRQQTWTLVRHKVPGRKGEEEVKDKAEHRKYFFKKMKLYLITIGAD